MRRNLSIASSALALGAALVVCACTDLLTEDPKGFTTTDTFYKTGADLNSATIAIYNSLRGLQGQAQWTTPELASDQTRAEPRAEPRYQWAGFPGLGREHGQHGRLLGDGIRHDHPGESGACERARHRRA